jgi:DNA polymerase-3 subunit gamma/tau
MPQNFVEAVALFDQHREALISSQLKRFVHLVAFEPGRIEFRPADGAPDNLANLLSRHLNEWTGMRWLVARSREAGGGAPTLERQEQARVSEIESEVARHPLVRAVLEAFPGATIAAVRERFTAVEPAGNDAPAADLAEDDPAASEEDEP